MYTFNDTTPAGNASFRRVADDTRKANRNRWVSYSGSVGTRTVQYKAFNTYIQILRIDGVDHTPGMGDESVRHFRDSLLAAFPD